MTVKAWCGAGVLLAVLGLVGCSSSPSSHPDKNAAVQAQRGKLTAEDRPLVDAQEWCVVNTDERLGSMGPPVKIEVGGQPVFLCCAGCKRSALADPDKTLAKVRELQAKAKAGAR